MQALAELAQGFGLLFSDGWALIYVAAGAVLGVLIGALPGLTTSAAIAMIAPVTFSMEPLSALVFLMSSESPAGSVVLFRRYFSTRPARQRQRRRSLTAIRSPSRAKAARP